MYKRQESGTVEILKQAGVGERIDIDGFVHEGTYLSSENKGFRVSFSETVGKSVTIFGQTEVTKDLYQKQEEREANIFFQVKNVNIIDPKCLKTEVIFEDEIGKEIKIVSDFVVGCDGFHGVSRQRIPLNQRKEYERVYPFGWLGILSETPPLSDELIYANTSDGFALCSMRNNNLSRYFGFFIFFKKHFRIFSALPYALISIRKPCTRLFNYSFFYAKIYNFTCF